MGTIPKIYAHSDDGYKPYANRCARYGYTRQCALSRLCAYLRDWLSTDRLRKFKREREREWVKEIS